MDSVRPKRLKKRQTGRVGAVEAEFFNGLLVSLLANAQVPWCSVTVNTAVLWRLVSQMHDIERIRPAKPSTQPRKTRTWCALKFKWTPVLAF